MNGQRPRRRTPEIYAWITLAVATGALLLTLTCFAPGIAAIPLLGGPNPGPEPLLAPTRLATPRPEHSPVPPAATLVPTVPPTASPVPPPDQAAAAQFASQQVERLLAGLSLPRKVGQMLLSGLHGAAPSPQSQMLLRDLGVGGVVYLAGNAPDPESVRALSRDLQANTALPLLIAIDHEGGRVVRFQSGVTVFPDPMALGATANPLNAYLVALASARELRYAGVNMDLGPLLDVNSNPANPVIGARAFGDDPQAVAAMGLAYLRGLEAGGVLAVGKHFPGHGSVALDSHAVLPTVEKSLDELLAGDLLPFQTAIAGELPAIMIGHLAAPAVDPTGSPASLSPALVQGLLRERLGFRGLVLTDAIEMGALSRNYTLAETCVQAVLAGNDMLLVREPATAQQAHAALLEAVAAGRLSEAQIDAAVRRVLAAKARLGLFGPAPDPPAPDYDANQALAVHVSRMALTLLPEGATLPLPPDLSSLLLVSPVTLPHGSQSGDGLSLLGERIRDRGVAVRELFYDPKDGAGMKQVALEVARLAPGYQAVVVVTAGAYLDAQRFNADGQPAIVRAALASGRPAVVAAVREPYDLLLFPQAPASLATYGATPAQLEALAGALLGEFTPGGRLPVRLGFP